MESTTFAQDSSMNESSRAVLAAKSFHVRPERVESLGNAGGFSGAEIFRVATLNQHFCLKRWPVGYDRKKLNWIHRVLVFAFANGCPEITKPIEIGPGVTFFEDKQNGLWELTGWAEGKQVEERSFDQRKLDSAIDFLARFHQATARFHLNFAQSRNVVMALARLKQFDSVLAAIDRKSIPESVFDSNQINYFEQRGRSVATLLIERLTEFEYETVPVQPVIRDVRPEHFFFVNNIVSGVVDFGAMRIDSAACDLSRLFSSLKDQKEERIENAICRYSRQRNLTQTEHDLIPVMGLASITVSILNWIEWVLIKNRKFDDQIAVKDRINSIFEKFSQQNL